ncbi:MAG: WD40/YVTN/BNR-like repeat-containing protein, partial [bacterium]
MNSSKSIRTFLAQFVFAFIVLLAGGIAGQLEAQEQKFDSNIVYDPAFFAGLDYRMVGPYRGGRVTAVAGVPGSPPTVYFGGTGGGVWKSTNNGRSYQNISDKYFKVGSIGSIAIAKSDPNVIYVGTGSACIRSNVSTGRGVYKSSDGAKTWTFIGLEKAGQIGKMAVHPDDPNLVYVAALGQAFGKNRERGVFRSKDGGAMWEQVLFISDSTGAVDISMNPQNPSEIYASMWRAERKPWTIISGGVEGGIYKTIDGGDSWKKLADGFPNGLIGKTAVSVSPANPQRVYVLVEAPDDQEGLYRSDDAGETFHYINPQKSLVFRPFYYTHITADPNDENTVYVNNEGFFKSVNAGSTFTRVHTPHGDNHDLWINPENSNYL